MFPRDYRKLCTRNQEGPEKCDRAEDNIGRDDAHGFPMKIGLVGMRGLHGSDLLRIQLNAGKNEYGPDENTADRAQGIEGLRKIQSPSCTLRVSHLCGEWV